MGFQIDRLTLRQIRMPLVHFFETSFGRTYERHMVLIEAARQMFLAVIGRHLRNSRRSHCVINYFNTNFQRFAFPLAITMREQIESMREWARTRARMASARGRAPSKKEGWMARYGAPTANLGDKGPESDDGERKLEL